MDTRKLTEILQATLDVNQRSQAEEQLAQIHKIIGFAPCLLQVIMSNEVTSSVRQAGAIYLKNLILDNWQEREADEGEPLPFHIHEQDRAMIRDAIVDAIVQAPQIIKFQLCVCIKQIIKNDFPSRWTQVVDKISIYLQSPDPNCLNGALLCLYQLVKSYEYRTAEKRAPVIEAMNLLLPMIYNLIVKLLPDQSEQSVSLQKLILKNFFTLIKNTLPLELVSKESFAQWMEVLRRVAGEPVPEAAYAHVDEDDRPELPWWKCKKWAIHTLHRIFERYGSPMNVRQEYIEFANWYLTTFTGGILEVLLKILDQYRSKVYVSPRVLQQTLNYIDQGVSHAHSWKLLKPHMFDIIKDVLFPLMSYSQADDELWASDPQEYIRIKFDIFEDLVSPVIAGRTVLVSACTKRKEMLHKTMSLCMEVMCDPQRYPPQQRDGALHMVGTLSSVLLKKPLYKEQMDEMITRFVFPEYGSQLGYLRARASWLMQSFATIKFKQDETLLEAVKLTVHALLNDSELPVKVEAALAIQMLLSHQDKVEEFLRPQVNTISLELLKVIRETENEDVGNVMQKIVTTYTEEIMPIAVDICEHLVTTFTQVMEADSGSDEKTLTALGLLGTIETIVSVMEDNKEVMAHLEKIVLRVVGVIFNGSAYEFYEEALSLLCALTSKQVSADMWSVLTTMYEVAEKDGFDYFTEMAALLHNYITVDADAFLANPNRILCVFNICKKVLNSDASEEAEVHAAKLLEVMVLQLRGRIDTCLPSFVELVLNRLTRTVKTSELRTMCLQVLIAMVYCNPHLLFSIIDKLQQSVPNASITAHFLKQWIHDTDCFLGVHGRKICVLGLCKLLEMGPSRPSLDECAGRILPACLMLFDGLKRVYEARADYDHSSNSSDDDDDDDFVELSSDEDEIDDYNNDYLESLAGYAKQRADAQGVQLTATTTVEDDDDDDDDDDDLDALEETSVECYSTPLDDKDSPFDEYVVFKEVLTGLSKSEPALYGALMSSLTEKQQAALQQVLVQAEQRRAQQESKRIEASGGYAFTVPASVPTKFKFGS